MNAADRIRQTLSAWPGVSEAPHRFGGIEFRYGGKELGHLHEDRLADLPFPRSVRDQLVANGEAEPHHIYPDSGWVSVWIRQEEDVDRIIRLFRMQYDRLVKKIGQLPQTN